MLAEIVLARYVIRDHAVCSERHVAVINVDTNIQSIGVFQRVQARLLTVSSFSC